MCFGVLNLKKIPCSPRPAPRYSLLSQNSLLPTKRKLNNLNEKAKTHSDGNLPTQKKRSKIWSRTILISVILVWFYFFFSVLLNANSVIRRIVHHRFWNGLLLYTEQLIVNLTDEVRDLLAMQTIFSHGATTSK